MSTGNALDTHSGRDRQGSSATVTNGDSSSTTVGDIGELNPHVFTDAKATVHHHCSNCHELIQGGIHHCADCGVDFCARCEVAGVAIADHDELHIMIKFSAGTTLVRLRDALQLVIGRGAGGGVVPANPAVDDGGIQGQPDVNVAHEIDCAVCSKPIIGVRYQCASCPAPAASETFSLCEGCHNGSHEVHELSHVFVKLPRPVIRPLVSSSPLVPPTLYKYTGRNMPNASREEIVTAFFKHNAHPSTLCDWCITQIEGNWYRCTDCGKDLCEACETSKLLEHDDRHVFMVFRSQVDMVALSIIIDLENPRPILKHPVY
ncbi:hypothetical protein BKA62DRAFT_717274 [Auriculariales sp. MPI-PUGE-AT-0066]|nr:hypothetical protein BKA62DRAFT_717274 [Auriculariales sp. MPI-PUGE-AT-0066]